MATVKKPIQKTEEKEVVKKMANNASGIKLPKIDLEKGKKTLTLYLRAYQNNQRQGNASTKTRANVSGTTKKIYKQKGTGRARHGSMRAPIFKGGGIVGGPQTKDYFQKINKKRKTIALQTALTLQNEGKNIIVWDKDMANIGPKTASVIELLKKQDLLNTKILVIMQKKQMRNLFLALRNIDTVTVCDIESINPFQILNNQKIVIVDSVLEKLNLLVN